MMDESGVRILLAHLDTSAVVRSLLDKWLRHSKDSGTLKGIPKATFIEDVDVYLKTNGYATIRDAMQALDQLYQKYKLMEQAFLQRKLRLLQQMPDITKTLDVVKHLEKKNEDFDVTFEVSDQLYTRAHIDKADKVGLWLGANVMLEYNLAEAKEILLANLSSAETSMADVEETLAFLKEQTTTVEVSLARLHNLNVKRNQAAAAAASANGARK
ncbi:Prefoldin subunit 3 [Echinococcus granulosus]|uniref:Prefoldin subunit 3 n=1 Tax=Echinococcus granulosus TaxID=6210 RepID=A0A068WFJ3_ECHGR|nr:Prefoldin subunit 3 [Echinococcus granulosus]CDS16374.1 prefoldin subunit 3 [Echinococcus granulosus]